MRTIQKTQCNTLEKVLGYLAKYPNILCKVSYNTLPSIFTLFFAKKKLTLTFNHMTHRTGQDFDNITTSQTCQSSQPIVVR